MNYLIGYEEQGGLADYLGFGAAFVGEPIPTKRHGDIRVIAVPVEHVNWQRMRLLSGNRGGGSQFSSQVKAQAEAELLATCL